MSDRYDPRFPLQDPTPGRISAQTVTEPEREIPVLAHCDVAVLGGGPSGVCAAVAAARQGASVILVERHGFLGGMATAGNVNLLHSLYGTDHKTKVIGGLPDEFIRRMQSAGAAYNAGDDGETSHWVVCSETAKFILDDMVIGSGCGMLLHTRFAGVLHDGRQVTAALIEGKSGREAIIAKTYIDCTGDADLIRATGVETHLGNAEGKCQAPSLCFRIRGVKPDAAPMSDVQAALFDEPMDYNGERYPTFLWGSTGVWDKSERMMAGTRVLNVNSADTLSLSRAEVEAHYQLRWALEKLKQLPGWEDVYLLDVASQIGLRESHRILADHELAREEVLHGVRFPDAIAQGTYPIDIHRPDGPGIYFEHLDGTWRRVNGDRSVDGGRWDGQAEGAPLRETLCYQVPLGCLIPRELDNVLVAGRCIGASHDSAGAIRVMMNCMQFGQAAGVASALAQPSGQVRSAQTKDVQAALVEMGAPLITA